MFSPSAAWAQRFRGVQSFIREARYSIAGAPNRVGTPMNTKLISAVVPVYNGAKYLAATLESILAQNYRPLEVIVVDDGSTDDTASIVRSYPEVVYIYQTNQGAAVAKNTGMAHSTGEFIAFLDADDIWPPSKLSAQIRYLAGHPEAGCIIGRMHNFLDEGVARPGWLPERMIDEDGVGLSLGASLVRRWVFDRIGGFNPRFTRSEDLDWFIRMKEADIPMETLPNVFLHRRIHASNVSNDQETSTRERLHILKELIDRKRGKAAMPMPGVRP
jgi:glycosyltransferase involved in cell wall biosynthesis